MRTNFIKNTLAIALSIICLGGSLAYASTKVNAQDNNINIEAIQEVSKEEVGFEASQEQIDKLNELYEKVNNNDLTLEEQKAVVSEIQEMMPEILKANDIKIGDTTTDVCNYLELAKANQEMKEFQRYLDTINVEQYQPMSQEQLEGIVGE